MKILRLTFFNLKKNRKEALAIAFLTFVTVMMISIFTANVTKMKTAFDSSFDATGSRNSLLEFAEGYYHDEYKDILKDMGMESEEFPMLFKLGLSVRQGDEKVGYNIMVISEENELKMSKMVLKDTLPEAERAALEHPVILPEYFRISAGFKTGDDFVIVTGGKDYPFKVAGFYEAGLVSSTGFGLKIIVKENDFNSLAGVMDEMTALSFDAVKDFKANEYIEKCKKASGENVDGGISFLNRESEKGTETGFIEVFLYITSFFSLITFASSIFMIRHKISNDIEDQMQQIGVLEAIGYKSSEISLSYLFEYVISAGSGAVLGGIAAFLMTPVMNGLIGIMMGRSIHADAGIRYMVLSAVTISVLVIAAALLKTRSIKRFPPVVAFRKGIRTHHFARNLLPLEKSTGNVNIRIAMRDCLKNIKTGLGTCLCVLLASSALIFGVGMLNVFKDGIPGLEPLMGLEIADERIQLLSGIDAYSFREELLKLPEVRKVNVTYDLKSMMVKDSVLTSAFTAVYDDYKVTENIFPNKGRFPEHDNEIMISTLRSKFDGLDVGDSIVLSGRDNEQKFIISGIVGSATNGGMNVYLTTEGFKKIHDGSAPDLLEVFLNEGEDKARFEKKVSDLFGGNAEASLSAETAGDSEEERIRAVAEKKIAALLTEYGVNGVDYAVNIDGKVIKGNSYHYAIKDMMSFRDLMKSQLGTLAEAVKAASVAASVIVFLVVAVILNIITSSLVKKKRKDLGIMKGLGYSSGDLMTQLAWSIMPTVIAGTLAASITGNLELAFFGDLVFGIDLSAGIILTAAADIILILFCYLIIRLGAGKIKKISVNELITE